MATTTQSGTVKSVTATASSFLLQLEWDIINPSPPPPTITDTQSWSIPAGPMRDLSAALKVGEAATVEYDTADPAVATGVRKP